MFYNNGRKLAIPASQRAQFECKACKETVFRPLQCVQFYFDRLNVEDMRAVPVMMYECLGCHGYLMKDKTGMYVTAQRAEPPGPGDEWKATPSEGE